MSGGRRNCGYRFSHSMAMQDASMLFGDGKVVEGALFDVLAKPRRSAMADSEMTPFGFVSGAVHMLLQASG